MISVIIPALNEKSWILNKTIKSIRETSPANTEIIVVDDKSDKSIEIEDKNVIFKKNTIRLGAAQSKHLGVCLSSNPYVFLTDSHVLFKSGWYTEALKSLENKPKSLYCGCCLGLSEEKFNLNQANGDYYAAKLFLHENGQFLDGKWTTPENENCYEISCVMGANYFMHKSWFFKIRGYSDLKAWGSEEPLISIKTWLSGGEVKMNKNVVTGHMFRKNAPYQTGIKYINYNKIRMALTLLPEELGNKLISKMNKDLNYKEAQKMINRELNLITEHKSYYNSLFVRDIYWLCNKFNIKIPE